MIREEKIIKKIKVKLGFAAEYHPFKNQFFWEPDPHKLGLTDHIENESILVLEKGFEAIPVDDYYLDGYFVSHPRDVIPIILNEYFSHTPLHKINNVSIDPINENNLDIKVKSFIELLNNHIKPKILLSFDWSGEVLSFLFQNFNTFKVCRSQNNSLVKCIILIGEVYYYFYYIDRNPGLLNGIFYNDQDIAVANDEQTFSRMPLFTKSFDRFLRSTLVFDYQTCRHLNYIKSRTTTFQFPSEPLNDIKVRESLINLTSNTFFSLPNIHPKAISETLPFIDSFDKYDIILSHLVDNLPMTASIGLSREELIQLRQSESSLEICERYFDPITLAYKEQILDLSLIRYYLFVNYPQLSFDMEWDIELKRIDLISQRYQSANQGLQEFISTTKS